jgi:hypothetical protein
MDDLAAKIAKLGARHPTLGDVVNEIFHPISERIVARCDGVLRIGGASQGADQMVALAQAHGRQVFYRLQDIPGCESLPDPVRHMDH